jgi:hypothetical protein
LGEESGKSRSSQSAGRGISTEASDRGKAPENPGELAVYENRHAKGIYIRMPIKPQSNGTVTSRWLQSMRRKQTVGELFGIRIVSFNSLPCEVPARGRL